MHISAEHRQENASAEVAAIYVRDNDGDGDIL